MMRLRRFTPDDADLLEGLVQRNIDHLLPWLGWAADEPLGSAGRREQLEDWDRQWEAGEDRHLLATSDGVGVGVVGLHRRGGPGVVEVGYWLDAAAQGHGTMTAAVSAAIDMAFADDGIRCVQIRHDRANARSGGVPRRLGLRFVDERDDEPAAPGESGREWTWETTRRWWGVLASTRALRIRSFVEPDRAAVIELWRSGDLIRAWNDPDRDIDRKVADSPTGLRVAVLDGDVVGTSMVGYDGHRGWINYLTVRPDRQGRGIGGRLVADAELWLVDQGCPKVNLQVRTDNSAAAELYRHLGYEAVDATDLGRRLVVDDDAAEASQDC